MQAQRVTGTVQTASDGSATAYLGTNAPLTGRIISITYTKDGTTPYDDTVDFTITVESTGQGVWAQSNVTATASVAPRQPTHNQSGVAALYASGGTAVNDHIYIAQDRIKIVLAQGGDTKSGSFTAVIG